MISKLLIFCPDDLCGRVSSWVNMLHAFMKQWVSNAVYGQMNETFTSGIKVLTPLHQHWHTDTVKEQAQEHVMDTHTDSCDTYSN